MMSHQRRLALLTTLIALAGLFVSLASTAQPRQRRGQGVESEDGGGGRHHRGPEAVLRQMDRLLELTDEQTAALTAIFEGQRENAEADRAAQRDNREALKAELESANPDPAVVGQLMLAGRQFREQMQEQRQQLKEEIDSVLTAEQQATWEGFQKGRRGNGRGMRGPRGGRGQRSEAGVGGAQGFGGRV